MERKHIKKRVEKEAKEAIQRSNKEKLNLRLAAKGKMLDLVTGAVVDLDPNVVVLNSDVAVGTSKVDPPYHFRAPSASVYAEWLPADEVNALDF